MANYTTSVSDKTKKTCKRLILMGGLGFQYFYVGKIKTGLSDQAQNHRLQEFEQRSVRIDADHSKQHKQHNAYKGNNHMGRNALPQL